MVVRGARVVRAPSLPGSRLGLTVYPRLLHCDFLLTGPVPPNLLPPLLREPKKNTLFLLARRRIDPLTSPPLSLSGCHETLKRAFLSRNARPRRRPVGP